ncbi:MAG: hypothetical protein U0840_14935 [Gemmataceae bacterium]
MRNLSQLLTVHAFPSGFDRIRRSFARQADLQTCGAAAIRHGLLLGGLTLPAATLEAVLEIRDNLGTTPLALRTCLRRLGFDPRLLRKPRRQSTRDFLDGLTSEFARGSYLLPCIRDAEHWVCVGTWQGGRVGMVDSFFDRRRPGTEPGKPLVPGLGFFSLTVEEFDALDWPHFITLVRPGRWERQYRAWVKARLALLRLPLPRRADGRPVTVVEAIQVGAHQYLDDADYNYRHLHLGLRDAATITVRAEDKAGEPVGLETVGSGANELVIVRRLGGVLSSSPAVPEVVLRTAGLRVGQLE